MINHKRRELLKSIEKIRKLTDFIEYPKTDDESLRQKVYRINLVISDLCEKGIITKNKATRLRNKIVEVKSK